MEIQDNDALMSLFTSLRRNKSKIDPKDYCIQMKGIRRTLEIFGLHDSNLYAQVETELKEQEKM